MNIVSVKRGIRNSKRVNPQQIITATVDGVSGSMTMQTYVNATGLN